MFLLMKGIFSCFKGEGSFLVYSLRGFSLWLARSIDLGPKVRKKHHGKEHVVEPSCSPPGGQEAESELALMGM